MFQLTRSELTVAVLVSIALESGQALAALQGFATSVVVGEGNGVRCTLSRRSGVAILLLLKASDLDDLTHWVRTQPRIHQKTWDRNRTHSSDNFRRASIRHSLWSIHRSADGRSPRRSDSTTHSRLPTRPRRILKQAHLSSYSSSDTKAACFHKK